MKFYYFLILIFFTMNAYSTEIVAHTGASNIAPQNTMPAFKLAWANGVNTVEGDFHLLDDGNIVCFHAIDELQKYWNFSVKKGDESKISFQEYKTLKMNLSKATGFGGLQIPSLEEVIAAMPPPKKIFIEIKTCKNSELFIKKLEEIREKNGVKTEQISIISFHSKVLEEFKQLCPKYKTYLLLGLKVESQTAAPRLRTPAEVIKKCRAIKADGVDLGNTEYLTKEFLAVLRSAKLEVHTWTVDDKKEFSRLKKLGVDSITTNKATDFVKK